MRTIDQPAVDPTVAYTSISASRQSREVRHRLLGGSGLVFTSYDAYFAARSDVTVLAPVVPAPMTADDLIGNYDSTSQASQAVRAAIFESNRGGRCPLCGQGRAS